MSWRGFSTASATDHPQVEGVGEADDGTDHLAVLLALVGRAGERGFYLEDVQGEALEFGERAVAGAEVVHGEA